MKKKTFTLALVSLTSVILLSGCSTAIMKASPFYQGSMVAGKTASGKVVRWDDPESVKIDEISMHKKKQVLDSKRVNVWPMLYHNFLVTSILWPIGEINDVGWEIRPFISEDSYNQDYRILNTGWNSKDGSHYSFPFYVKTKNDFYNFILLGGYSAKTGSHGLFPLYIWDNPDSSLYTLPFWSTNGGKDIAVIPPLFMKHRGEYDIIWPLGKLNYETRTNDDDKEEKYLEDAWFFPLFGYIDEGEYGYALWPLFMKSGDEYDFIWPLGRLRFDTISNSDDKKEKIIDALYFFPLFGYIDRGESIYSIPLYIRNKHNDYTDNFFLWPFSNLRVPSEKQKENGYQGHIFPFFANYHDSDSRSLMISPFYWEGYNKSKQEEWMHIPPFYMHYKDGSDEYNNYLLLAGTAKKEIQNKDYLSWYLFPLIARNYNADCDYVEVKVPESEPKQKHDYLRDGKRYRVIKKEAVEKETFFLNSYISETPELDKCAFKFFPLYSYSRDKDTVEHSNLLGLNSISWDSENKKLEANALTYLYYHKSNENKSTTYLFPSFYNYSNKTTERSIHSLIPFYHFNKTSRDSTSFIFPNYYSYENKSSGESSTNMFPFLFYSKNEYKSSLGLFLWLYTRKNDLGRKRLTEQALWYLYYHDSREKTETQEESATTRILWKLYHSEQRGDTTNVDIFPFIAYSGDKEKSKLSFAWRFFSVEKSKEQTKVHFLYIPVWW